MGGGFEEMQPIFRLVVPQWSNPKHQNSKVEIKKFIFHVHASKVQDSGAVCIQVTDFHENTLQGVKSVLELEDLRERIGIGGPFTYFVDYLKGCFKSEDLKLVLEGQSKSGGAASARVIAQKSDWNPTISISLTKLGVAAASEAMANITLDLFKLYTNVHELMINGQIRCVELSTRLAAEQGKNDVIQGQLEASLASRALVSTVTSQEKNIANQRELDASPSYRALTAPASRLEKSVANQRERDASPPCRALAATVSHLEKRVSNQRELDAPPPTRPLAPSVSRQEKNVANQRELDASLPSRPLAPSVSRQEKNVANQRRELNASLPSWPLAPSVSRQEKYVAIERELYASPPFRAFASVSRQETNVANQIEQDASSTSRPQKFRKISDMSIPAAQTLLEPSGAANLQDSSEKRRAKITPSSNTNRVIPAYRRQKVEGVVLLDSGDERSCSS